MTRLLALMALLSCGAFAAEAPLPLSAPAQAALTPTAAAALSPTAASALSPSAEAEPEIIDDAEAVSATALDLAKAETRLLAKISETLAPDEDSILFNVADNAPAAKAGPDVNSIDAAALYAELAKRTIAEDKDARQALGLAALRGDKRAIEAKQEAFEARLAAALIKRYDNGDKGAKDELMKQALKGNKAARLYLGLDKPVAVGIPEALTPTAAPAALTPAAAAVSGSAKP
jgi:hypothetical protein